MRAADVVGRRIVSVEQYRRHNPQTGRMFVAFESLTLDNGSRIYISTVELGDDYGLEANVVKQRRGRKA